ncbi:MAG: D-alanine--D-alanine ligase [Planctomycetota bacterium]|nr:D-alanine--D-alanine ligase [Planctomycetota bacterium]
MTKLRVLHLIGSAESDFFRELSFAYAGDCLEATDDPSRYENLIACVTPDGKWRFTDQFSRAMIEEVEPVTLSDAMRIIESSQVDVALPQMFCMAGMTDYRSLLHLLRIPFVGNLAPTMSLTADKAKARAVVAAHGVPVPEGEIVHCGQIPTIECPAVVKPVDADNSVGLSLVRSSEEYPAAIAQANERSNQVLVERFIPAGREVRCGVIDKGTSLECLPLQEYWLDEQMPIRGYESKLTSNEDGEVDLASKYHRHSWIIERDDPVARSVGEIAKQCHVALGCRDYSLFDFRVDPNGRPYFLEAGLYCSFAPNSIITSMVVATGKSLDAFLHEMLFHAIDRDVNLTDPSVVATHS